MALYQRKLTGSGTKPSDSSWPMLNTDSTSESILTGLEEKAARAASCTVVDTGNEENEVGHEATCDLRGRLSRTRGKARAQSRERAREGTKGATLAILHMRKYCVLLTVAVVVHGQPCKQSDWRRDMGVRAKWDRVLVPQALTKNSGNETLGSSPRDDAREPRRSFSFNDPERDISLKRSNR